MDINQMMELLNQQRTFALVRHFTVQAIKDCNFLTLSLKNLQRMYMQYNQ